MILDVDAETLVIDHLIAELPARGIGATCLRPGAHRRRPERRTCSGGPDRWRPRDLVTDQAQLTVDVRAGSSARAMYVLSVVRALLGDSVARVVGGAQIYTVDEMAGPYSNPAPTDPYRYSMTFLVAIRSGQIA